MDDKRVVKSPHNLILEDRKALMITGVSDVDSFDDQTIVVYTDKGEMTIKGIGLHIDKLSLETGELKVNGNVVAIVYTDDKRPQGGFFGRLFK